MFDSLQETVDRLASSLERSVFLVDADFVLIAHSRQFEGLDPAQLGVLTQRHVLPELVSAIRADPGFRRHAPFTIARRADAGVDVPRVFFPLQSRFQFLGLLGILTGDPLAPEALEVVAEAAEVCRHLLERMAQSIDATNATIEAEMLGLLTDDEESRQAAARELNELGMYNRSRHFVAICLRVPDEWSPWGGPPPREVLSRLLLRAITTPMIDAYSFVPTLPESFILIGFAHQPRQEAIAATVGRIDKELRTALDGDELVGVIGIGGIVGALADAWPSFDQALVAADVAGAQHRRSMQWDQDPTATSLAAVLAPRVAPHLRTSSLRRLSEADPATIELLELYFAEAGSVSRVAARLHVHRATVYQRLDRAARGLGLDFDDGDQRLIAQAWLARQRFE